jgi:hypothetical protein
MRPAPRVLKPMFYKLGLVVAKYPLRVIAASLLVASALIAGVFLTETSTGYDVWYPQKSEAQVKYKAVVEPFFPVTVRYSGFNFKASSASGAGVISKATLISALELHSSIVDSAAFGRLCARQYAGGPCQISSLLDAWQFNASVLAADPDVSARATARHADAGAGVVLGGVTTGAAGSVQSAAVLASSYVLSVDSEADAAACKRWEQDHFLARCRAFTAAGATVQCQAARSWDDESGRALNDDQYIMTLSMALMMVYVSAVLGPWHLQKGKFLLGFSIVVSVGLALGVAFGVAGYAGLPFTVMSFMTIFILLGIGIDDMFILVDAFERAPSADPGLKLATALEEVGCSITMTSLTDGLAFMIGGFVDLPAVSYFCVTAAVAVVSVFAFQVWCACENVAY